jgi:hypothetical protein
MCWLRDVQKEKRCCKAPKDKVNVKSKLGNALTPPSTVFGWPLARAIERPPARTSRVLIYLL